MSTNFIEIEVEIGLTPEKVWNYWTESKHIMNWNFAIPEWHCPFAVNDLRVGGNFTYRMEAKDGSFGFDFGGTFTEVEPHKLVAYTLGDGRKVRIVIEPVENGVKITEFFEPENQNPLEMQRGGWLSILTNFKTYAESQG